MCDLPNCDNNRVNIESDLEETLSNRDTSIVYSSKIDPILEEFTGELAYIAPIPPGIVKADFDLNDDTSSDNDDCENIEYVDATPPNSELVSLEEGEDDILRDKLSNVYLLISKIEALNDNPTLSSFSNSDNSFSDHTEETRSGSTTTHANYSLPENDSFLFEIEPDQGGITSVVISNIDLLLESPEFESFHFDIYAIPSFPRPPPEPPDVELCLKFETIPAVKNDSNKLHKDECFDPWRGEDVVFLNIEEDDSFTFTIRTFLPFITYPEDEPTNSLKPLSPVIYPLIHKWRNLLSPTLNIEDKVSFILVEESIDLMLPAYCFVLTYGYIKNHKKTVKNRKTRTRERKSLQEPEAKVKKIDNSRALQQNGKDKVVISKALISSPSSKAIWKMGKHNEMIGFTLESLTEQTQIPHNGLPRWQSV
ncbi:hypothetical protein Tco_0858093 [Tanacetum coccineum]|uniref:Uncharacterized protein n=1 Tax=Tanacetum coccineum TaxID=301880 RepID=A0ABQ5B8X9_9ASTR